MADTVMSGEYLIITINFHIHAGIEHIQTSMIEDHDFSHVELMQFQRSLWWSFLS